MIVNASVKAVKALVRVFGGATTVAPFCVNDKDRDRCRIDENFRNAAALPLQEALIVLSDSVYSYYHLLA